MSASRSLGKHLFIMNDYQKENVKAIVLLTVVALGFVGIVFGLIALSKTIK